MQHEAIRWVGGVRMREYHTSSRCAVICITSSTPSSAETLLETVLLFQPHRHIKAVAVREKIAHGLLRSVLYIHLHLTSVYCAGFETKKVQQWYFSERRHDSQGSATCSAGRTTHLMEVSDSCTRMPSTQRVIPRCVDYEIFHV